MGDRTKIPWCDNTFNPWWGCVKIAPECKGCYAEKHGKRFGTSWGPKASRRFFGDKHWNEPLKWHRRAQKAGVPERVFCGSMCDVFEDRRDLDSQRERLWDLIQETPMLTWLLLTKRPENFRKMVPWMHARRARHAVSWSNVWLGITAGTQERLDTCAPYLLDAPAVVRFISVEPILEPLNLDVVLSDRPTANWIIVGDESGYHRRPANLEWVRNIQIQCERERVAFFFKQWHHASFLRGDRDIGKAVKDEKPMLDGVSYREFPG
jgi:protein gp37